MRRYAYLKKPLGRDGESVYKIMLYTSNEGTYLFEYTSPDAVISSSDRLYGTPGDVYGDWDGLIDENGWIDLEDPLPDCQHDAFLPLRVKGRKIGRPEWGKYEVLEGGEWKEYRPE